MPDIPFAEYFFDSLDAVQRTVTHVSTEDDGSPFASILYAYEDERISLQFIYKEKDEQSPVSPSIIIPDPQQPMQTTSTIYFPWQWQRQWQQQWQQHRNDKMSGVMVTPDGRFVTNAAVDGARNVHISDRYTPQGTTGQVSSFNEEGSIPGVLFQAVYGDLQQLYMQEGTQQQFVARLNKLYFPQVYADHAHQPLAVSLFGERSKISIG